MPADDDPSEDAAQDADVSPTDESPAPKQQEPQQKEAGNAPETDGSVGDDLAEESDNMLDFPVVGIGASAGGLGAFQTFLEHLPADPGMAFVFVQHLDPEHESELPDILQRITSMDVAHVEDDNGTRLEPNRIYVIPPGRNMRIEEDELHLSPMTESSRKRAPIDLFFRSLADSQDGNAVGVVLSGSGSGGTTGLKRIKERGGITLAQDPDDAEFEGMPQSAVRSGIVDVVAPAAELAEQLARYRDALSQIQLPSEAEELPDDEEEVLSGIFRHLKDRAGNDFSDYKRSTMLRRIGRRMQVHHIEEMSRYLTYLREHEDEAQALLQDLLITVTDFFRDPEAFETLQQEVIPTLFAENEEDRVVRVWAAGCATGEEAYSLAISLHEYAANLAEPPEVQVFATDLGEKAIRTARAGFYPENIAADVSEERLQRFFEAKPNGYQVRHDVRESVIFAEHDLMSDPPFSQLDLVVCRNLLIYLKRDAQRSLFEVFHYALRPGGYLFLGSAESGEGAKDLFRPANKDHRIYQRKDDVERRPQFQKMPFIGAEFKQAEHAREEPRAAQKQQPSFEDVYLQLLDEHAPPGVVVSAQKDIAHVFKGAEPYLRVTTGTPTQNVLEVVRPELRTALRRVLLQAKNEGKEVRSREVSVEVGKRRRQVELVARDVEGSSYVQVFFERVEGGGDDEAAGAPEQQPAARFGASSSPAEHLPSENRDEVIEQLENELNETRRELQSTVEEYETSMEELRASNEELQSMNEELRSTTEELETSKEELRSMNEELSTVNQELNTKNDELARVNSDLENLLTSTEIATVFLDRDLRVQRYTPRATDLFNLIESDRGRPLKHVTRKYEHDGLEQDARRVLDRLTPVEREVQNEAGQWFLARMQPYRTTEDKIDGVVLTFVDITERKEMEEKLRRNAEKHQILIESVTEYAIITTNTDGRIATWNEGAQDMLGYRETEAIGQPVEILFSDEDREAGAAQEEMRIAEEHGQVRNERWHVRKSGERFWGSGVMTALRTPEGKLRGYAKVMRDNTRRKEHEEKLQALNEKLEERVKERTGQVRRLASSLTMAEQRERQRIAQVLHDSLQQLLFGLEMDVRQLRRGLPASSEALSEDDHQPNVEMLQQMESTLDEAIEETRTLTAELSPPVLREKDLDASLQWLAEHMQERHDLAVEVAGSCSLGSEDLRVLLFQMVRELLFNVVKHADIQEARVAVDEDEEHLAVNVEDDGDGFDAEAALSDGESGFGLKSVRERLELIGGHLDIESADDDGASVTITVPRSVGGNGA